MTSDSNVEAEIALALEAARWYASLMEDARPAADREEPGLGGRLLYVAGLDGPICPLVIAANVAGAATLAASDDSAAQKQALRDGVVDFLVSTLDEALRILKNEVRKRQPVAVCVGIAPGDAEREMRERGVEPDLPGPDSAGVVAPADTWPAARRIVASPPNPNQAALYWSAAAAPARTMLRMDHIALECLGPEEAAARRWLRLSPRYLGRRALRTRVVECSRPAALAIGHAFGAAIERGEIPASVYLSPVEEALAEESPSFSFDLEED